MNRILSRVIGATDSRPAGSETLFRRLTLTGPRGEIFLDRFGIGTRLFGIYLHRIAGPDPGLDLHDHPWPFVTLILSGGYVEEVADTRDAPGWAQAAEMVDETCRHAAKILDLPPAPRGARRSWTRGTIHRIRLTQAHRITETLPRTWTLVLRGPKSRPWGFYLPTGYVVQTAYDYRARRPLAETRGRHDPDPERTVFLDGLGNTIGEAGS